jgi:hypothetical protein
VKIVPPLEWTDALPDIEPRLKNITIKDAIQQNFQRSGGLPSGVFRQLNIETKKAYSVNNWHAVSI